MTDQYTLKLSMILGSVLNALRKNSRWMRERFESVVLKAMMQWKWQ